MVLVRPKPPKCKVECFFNEEVRCGLVIDWYLKTPWTRVDHYIDRGHEGRTYRWSTWEITNKNNEIVSWVCSNCYVSLVLLQKLKMGIL